MRLAHVGSVKSGCKNYVQSIRHAAHGSNCAPYSLQTLSLESQGSWLLGRLLDAPQEPAILHFAEPISINFIH